MSSTKKGGRFEDGCQEEEPRHWMEDETEIHEQRYEEAAQEEPQIERRKNQDGTPEEEFRALISTLHSMIGAMRSMEQRMDRYWGESEEGDRRRR